MNFNEIQIKEINKRFPSSVANKLLNNPSEELYLETLDILGALRDDENPYLQFYKYLKDTSDLSQDILEISGGHFARLGQRIASYQMRIASGSITVYDPELLLTNGAEERLVLMPEKLLRSTDISDKDLVIGLKPCDPTEEVIKTSCENQKDFIIALCACDHSPSATFDGHVDLYSYREDLRDITKRMLKHYDNGELVETVLEGNYREEIPIWRNQKAKRR